MPLLIPTSRERRLYGCLGFGKIPPIVPPPRHPTYESVSTSSVKVTIVLFLLYPVQRVHWLRARAQKNRWSEEFTLIQYEMKWTVNYFINLSDTWKTRAKATKQAGKHGAAAYANRQCSVWRAMAAAAEKSFNAVQPNTDIIT